MTIAEFKIELATLIKKGWLVGLSGDVMADKLIDAAEHLTSNGESDERAEKFGGLRTTRLAL
jgi:hypothetical protein